MLRYNRHELASSVFIPVMGIAGAKSLACMVVHVVYTQLTCLRVRRSRGGRSPGPASTSSVLFYELIL